MSDPRPPEPGTAPLEGPGAATPPPEGTPEPAVPPIDLSEPEMPEPVAPDDTDAVEATDDGLAHDAPAGAGTGDSGPESSSPPLAPAPGGTAPPAAAGPGDEGADDAAAAKGPNLKVLVAIMAIVTVALLGAVIYLLTKTDGETSATTTTTIASSSTTINTTPVNTADWVTETDEASGFTIKRPKDWIPSGDPEGQNRLLLSAGEQNFLLVTARNVDPSTVAAEIQEAMSDLEIIEGPTDLDIGGFPAVLYIYKTPLTEENREEGVIVHYFVVRDSKMYSLIFQARPKDELNRLARVFNAVTNSFQSTSADPAPDPIPTTDTTVAGTTSTTG